MEKHSYTEKQCPHGMCLDHSPEWERIGEPEFVPNPDLFGKHSLFHRHCGQRMLKVEKLVKERCKRCGREGFEILDWNANLCECCGYHSHTLDYGM